MRHGIDNRNNGSMKPPAILDSGFRIEKKLSFSGRLPLVFFLFIAACSPSQNLLPTFRLATGIDHARLLYDAPQRESGGKALPGKSGKREILAFSGANDSSSRMPNAPALLFAPPAPPPAAPEPEPRKQPSSQPPGEESTKPSLPANAPPVMAQPSPDILVDDLDKKSLLRVIENHLAVLERQNTGETLKLANIDITRDLLKKSLEAFLRLLNENLTPEEFSRKVREDFFFHPVNDGKGREALITGYYTPIIKASRFKTPEYSYPIYRRPDKLIKLDYFYDQRDPNDPYAALRFGIDGPRYTREDIDGDSALSGQNLEIAWLKDEMDRYFLHIQGSGILEYADGSREGVQYASSNGYAYESVGQMLLRDGVLSPNQGSMQGIKQHFKERPENVQKYLFKNKRYIFFDVIRGNPRGAGASELVGERSVAMDDAIYPLGALVYLSAKKPVLDGQNEITGWEGFSRFALNQDKGSAIKGPHRVDLYFGVGDRAGAAAGRFMQRGPMYILVKKETAAVSAW